MKITQYYPNLVQFVFLYSSIFILQNLYSQTPTKYLDISFGYPTNLTQPLSPLIKGYGFNAAYSMYDISLDENGTNINDYLNSGQCAYYDSRYINSNFFPLFDKISSSAQATILRFPGGTIGNFYHLGTVSNDRCSSSKVGYGLIYNEMNAKPDFRNDWFKYDEFHKRNAAFDMIELIKGQQKQVNVILTLNLLTHFINNNGSVRNGINNIGGASDFSLKLEENLDLIRLFQFHNINVVGVELGNELGYAEWTDSFPWDIDLDEYTDLLIKYSVAIKNEFPTIKIGVPTSKMRSNLISPWNQNLFNNRIRFDAFVLHRYYNQNEPVDGGSTYDFINTIFSNELNNFNNTYNSEYQKKIWLTEWNLDFEENSTLNNDITNASYIINFLTFISQYNRDNFNVIEFPLFHNLARTSNTNPVIFARGNNKLRKPFPPNTFQYLIPELSANQSLFGAFIYNQIPIDWYRLYYPTTDLTNYLVKNISDGTNSNISRDLFYIKTLHTKTSIFNDFSRMNYVYYANLTNDDVKFSLNNISISNNNVSNSAINLFNNNWSIYSEVSYLSNLDALDDPGVDLSNIMSKSYTFNYIQNGPLQNPDLIIPKKSIGILKFGYDFPTARTSSIDNNGSLDIYPNPISDRLFVKNNEEMNGFRFCLIDLFGTIVSEMTLQGNLNSIDMGNFVSGIYFYNIYDERNNLLKQGKVFKTK